MSRFNSRYGRHWVKFSRQFRLGKACVICGLAQGRLEVAHLLDVVMAPAMVRDERNLVVLCQPCHCALDQMLGVLRCTPRSLAKARAKRPLYRALLWRRAHLLAELIENERLTA